MWSSWQDLAAGTGGASGRYCARFSSNQLP
jgi:hypothetical protein